MIEKEHEMALACVYLIGDSISFHYGAYLRTYLQNFYEFYSKPGDETELQQLETPVGGNGGDSSMVLAHLQGLQNSGSFHSDLIVINCGLHDIKTDTRTGEKQVPLTSYQLHLEEIIACVREMGAQLLWIRTTPVDEKRHNKRVHEFHRFTGDQQAYNSAADEIMYAHQVAMIDLETFTRNLGDKLYCDHVHFTKPVRQAQAAFIAGYLTAFLDSDLKEFIESKTEK